MDSIISSHVVPEDIDIIQNLKLSHLSSPDLLGWSYTDSGIYTVKSGYWLATHLPKQEYAIVLPQGLIAFKEALWKLKISPKIRHFLWRILSNAMAIGTTLAHRGIITNPQCRRCCSCNETMEHHFFKCNYAQGIW